MTDALREALRQVSLCSQNSSSSKEECGRIARAALAAQPAQAQPDMDEWESRSLGASEVHAQPAPPELEVAVDKSLGLKAISIRLPINVINAYKSIKKSPGVGYQTLMRDAICWWIDDSPIAAPVVAQPAAQPAQALTDEHIDDLILHVFGSLRGGENMGLLRGEIRAVVRFAERSLAAQPAEAPVARFVSGNYGFGEAPVLEWAPGYLATVAIGTALYASPVAAQPEKCPTGKCDDPARDCFGSGCIAAQPAQPLTDEQIASIVREARRTWRADGTTSERIARAVERAHGIGGK